MARIAEIAQSDHNPLFWHLWKYMTDPNIRFIINKGGSSSGKSYSIAQILLLFVHMSGENALVMRKVGASIQKGIYEDFKVAHRQLGMTEEYTFGDSAKRIKHVSGARIDFAGLDDPEKIKGISNYRWVFLDEFSEFDEADFKQIRKRLRGKAGQQIIAAFNPISEQHWIKRSIIDTDTWEEVPQGELKIGGLSIRPELCSVKSISINGRKSILNPRTHEIETHEPDTVVLQSTYLNNFWVVGSPDGKYGYYDEQCVADFEKDRVHDPDYYNVYALGEWGVIRTGSEFFGSFNRGKHCCEATFDESLPIHLSIDSNVLPYISVQYWQASITSDGVSLRQIGETCAKDTNNTVRKAAKLTAERLREMGYFGKVCIHGDASTRAANNIDDEKRSFHDLFIATLNAEGYETEDMVSAKNPSVAMSGEFINAVFEGIVPGFSIAIGDCCQKSIEDYLCVKKDANGGILKTKVKNKTTMQTYEEHGHMCLVGDTLVSTSVGEMPIRKVKIGDMVHTEKGLCEVRNSLCTSWKSHYFLVSLYGRTLKLTYNHPIKTQRGFVPAYQLQDGDIITLFDNGKIWKEKLSVTKASSLIATQIANVRATASILAAGLFSTESESKSTCIGSCGLKQMAKFLKAIVCIILTAITITTHLATLPLCLLPSMRGIIRGFSAKRRGTRLSKRLRTTTAKPQSGTEAKPEKPGTRKTQRSSGKIASLASSFASNAAKPLMRLASKLRDFALTTVRPSGAESMDSTMRSALVQCAALNLWSIGTLIQSAARKRVPMRIGGLSSVYDITTDNHEFFANGILVHNSDCMRYMAVDLMREEFIRFSNRRKRNLYARDGFIHFFNPQTECDYSEQVVYFAPNVGGSFVLIRGAKCGENWHILDASLADSESSDGIKSRVAEFACENTIAECGKAYFPMIREMRADGLNVRVAPEAGDIDRRIAATSDYVRQRLLFSEAKAADDEGYAAFMESLLDYNANSEAKQASALLSGFVVFCEKSFPSGQ